MLKKGIVHYPAILTECWALAPGRHHTKRFGKYSEQSGVLSSTPHTGLLLTTSCRFSWNVEEKDMARLRRELP